MKKRLLMVLSVGIVLCGCSSQNKHDIEEQTIQKGMKNVKGKIALELEFDQAENEWMQKADGYSNGSMFNCTWRGNNVTFENSMMQLKIDKEEGEAKPPWSGAEYRSRNMYHYGMYEVRMKPIKNDGVVSSFFTYTGPSDQNPWDEIDIEFLGKDTTKVQFNYFTDGIGEHEYVYDLGFDASQEFHEYAFEWLQDSITWYVDGIEVYKATENIPQTPGKLMMNAWTGIGVDSWLGSFDGTVPLVAEYDWIRVAVYDDK